VIQTRSPQTSAATVRPGSFHARRRTLALAAAALLTLGAWPAAAQDASPAGTDAFPLTLVDDEGTSVEIAAEPQRVISLSPANTEIVFALGAGDRLLGGTDFDDFPAEAAALTDVATFNGVLMEQVVALEPDLVLAAGNFFTPPADIARMRELGYPVVVVYAETVDEVLGDIELIGDALGEGQAARDLTAAMRADIDQITAAVAATGDRPRTFYQIGSEPEIYAPAPGSFVADMVALAGGDPITTNDPNVFSIPVEQLVAADPEVIVVGDALYGVCPDAVISRPGWNVMSAVRTGDVRPVDDTVITRPGPRLAQGLANLARAIHPELELDTIPVVEPPCPVAVGGSPLR
jgi:iron complex transport system substrate-binding protein